MNPSQRLLMMPIEKLTAYARNPRKNDAVVDKMKASIQEFGFRIPIVATSDGTVVDGHLRLKAAKELGLTEVPVIPADDLSEARIKAFRLLANQSANWAEWDDDLLKLEFEELKDMNFDLELTGFDLEDIERFLHEAEPDEVSEHQDDLHELETGTVVSQPGDIWILGKHRVMCGDGTSPADVALLMNGFKVDTVFTDPPYDFEECHYADILRDFSEDANVFIMNNDINMIRYLRQSTLDFRKFFVADLQMAIPQGREPYLSHILISHEKNGNAKGNKNKHDGLRSIIPMPYRGTLHEEKTLHKHQKSVAFISLFLDHYQAGSVLDIFGGSGSTLIACEDRDIPCFMMEVEPQYVDVIVRRWQRETGKKALHEATGRTFQDIEHEVTPCS